MSRKKVHRRSNRNQREHQHDFSGQERTLLEALDGYSNAAAFLGEDSPLISSGTFQRSNLTANTELLTTTYRESWLAKRIIDMPSEDMTRSWYTLSTSMPEEDIQDLKRLEAEYLERIKNGLEPMEDEELPFE